MGGWFRHEYHDKLTDDLIAVEVIPDQDVKEHTSSENCDCIPIYRSHRDGVVVLIHNAFDGREYGEKGNRERGH